MLFRSNYGSVYTEIEALNNLAEIEVVHAASGGVGGSEGSQSFLIKGAEIEVDKVIEILRDIKGEEPLYIENIDCPCQEPCLFPYK